MTAPTPAPAPERRVVTNPHFRWMKDMLVVCPSRHEGATGYFVRIERPGYVAGPFDHPDPNDTDTLRCMLILVREAWNDNSIELDPNPGRLRRRMRAFSRRDGIQRGVGATRFDALAAALEAAPVKETT